MAGGKADDESCGKATAEEDNVARRRSERRAAERGIAGHALDRRLTVRGAEAIRAGRLPSLRDARCEPGGVAPLDRSNP